jgi:tRNA (guanine37-N1)-methyltransferase
VRRWRLRASIRRTLERRPDLLGARARSGEEERLIADVRAELGAGPLGALGADAPGSD